MNIRQLAKTTGLKYDSLIKCARVSEERCKEFVRKHAPKFPIDSIQIEVGARSIDSQSKDIPFKSLRGGERVCLINTYTKIPATYVKYDFGLKAYIFEMPEGQYRYKILTEEEAARFRIRKENV